MESNLDIKRKKIIKRIMFSLIALVCIIYYFFKAHYGTEIDEAIGITCADMWLKGNFFLKDTWAPLQFDSLFITPFLYLYELLPIDIGVTIFLRYIYIFFHFIIALFVFLSVRRIKSDEVAFLSALASFLFFFNRHALGYKAFAYWFSICIIMCLLNFSISKKKIWIALSALFLIFVSLGYIGMTLLIVPMIIAVWFISDKKKSYVLLLLGWTLFFGLCFLVFLLCNISFGDIIFGLKNTLLDEHHQGQMVKRILILGIGPLMGGVVANFVIKPLKKRKWFSENFGILLVVAIWVAYAGLCLAKISTFSATRSYYVLFIAFLLAPSIIENRKENFEYYLIFWLPAVFYTIVLIICTNQGFGVTVYGAIFAVIGMIIYGEDYYKGAKISLVALLALAFFLFIPENSFKTIVFQERKPVTVGIDRGISTLEEKWDILENTYYEMEPLIDEGDKLLIVSDTERACQGYMIKDIEYAACTPDEHPLYSDRIVRFFEYNPQRIPNKVIVDSEFFENYEKWLSEYPLGRYISENYVVEKKSSSNRYFSYVIR